MTRSVEDRADRMMRRRYDGWVDRGALSYSGIRLSVALRDVERALFSWAGPNVKPNWSAALRPFLVGGAVAIGFGIAAMIALLLGWFPA